MRLQRTPTGEGDTRGPWNASPGFDFREGQAAVDGGNGDFKVSLQGKEVSAVAAMAKRLASDLKSDPVTGADLGAGKPLQAKKSARGNND